MIKHCFGHMGFFKIDSIKSKCFQPRFHQIDEKTFKLE